MLLGVRRFNALLVSFVFLCSGLLLLRRLIYLTNAGGGEFQHADWLINFSGGIVRRGISGEVFLNLSHILNVSPLLLVSVVQAVLTIALLAALLVKALHLRMPDLAVILLLSPALVLFWVNDTSAAYRKEILGLAAFLPLLFPRTSGPAGVVAVLVIFALSVLFHEGNLVLAPALTMALYLRLGPTASLRPILWLWGIALATTVYAMSFKSVPDVGPMCTRLLEAGLTDRLCYGIFPWLEDDFKGGAAAVQTIVLERVNLPLVVMITALLLLPVFWIASRVLQGRLECAAFLISFGAIFALYPIATDWSRWLSMQVFVMTFLLLMLSETRPGLERPVPKVVYGLVLAFCLGFGIDQIAPEPLRGFVFNFAQAVGAVFGRA